MFLKHKQNVGKFRYKLFDGKFCKNDFVFKQIESKSLKGEIRE